MKKTALVAAFAILLTGLSMPAFATVVQGTSNIFGAISLTGAGDGSGTAPPVVAVTGGVQITFTSVTGNVSCSTSACAGGNGGDGGIYSDLPGSTAITAPGNGISGITFTQDAMFLVGVFINSSALPTTGPGPTSLNYGNGGPNSTTSNATDAPTFQPGLNRVFFIGDGAEGFNGVCPGPTVQGLSCVNGQVQLFFVPTGANELFLGFADGAGVVGTPGDYGDNTAVSTLPSALSPPLPSPEPWR